MEVEKLLSIITINYNGLKDTCELIDTLPLNDETIEVIVVDNASTQDEATELEKRYPLIIVIRSDKNLGFAGGNNLGIQAAHGKYLFFINNDAILPQPSALSLLITRLESSDQIGMVCPKIRFTWGKQPIQYAGYTPLSKITLRNKSIGFGEQDNGQYDTPHPTPYAHGAAMMVKREIIEKVGMMPECYFLYYEELDWSMMIRRAGYEIWYEPVKTYFITRNRLLFAQRNAQKDTKYLTYVYLIIVVATKDISFHFLRGKFNLACAVIKGITDFIKI